MWVLHLDSSSSELRRTKCARCDTLEAPNEPPFLRGSVSSAQSRRPDSSLGRALPLRVSTGIAPDFADFCTTPVARGTRDHTRQRLHSSFRRDLGRERMRVGLRTHAKALGAIALATTALLTMVATGGPALATIPTIHTNEPTT